APTHSVHPRRSSDRAEQQQKPAEEAAKAAADAKKKAEAAAAKAAADAKKKAAAETAAAAEGVDELRGDLGAGAAAPTTGGGA
ncbi:cell envelope integrity protein TolA, partial [Salmonella enterica subsp. enterica serovar Infantis]